MNEIILKGTQKFMGKEIPVVYGGFGENNKCITDKTIAELHDIETKKVRERITNNINRFKENTDFIDLKIVVRQADDNLLSQLGYTNMEIVKSNHIYLLSRRGYAKLIKIFDTDLAWEVYENLLDKYFYYEERETTQLNLSSISMKVQALEIINETAKIILPVVEDSGIETIHKTYLLKQLYSKADIEIPMIRTEQYTQLYDKTMIADELGIYSISNKPHAQAVGAIIKKLDVDNNDIVLTSFNRNGHTGTDYQYKPIVIQQINQWLEDNKYPKLIDDDNKSYKVTYKKVGALV